MEEPSEPVVEEGEEFHVRPRSKAKGPLLKIVAIVVALAVVGIGAWWLFLSNGPPSAAFTVRSDDLRVVADASNSTDPNGNIATYSWNWGDGTTGSGRLAAHEYLAEQSYTIALTVTDTRGASSGSSKTVSIQVFPTAQFVARAEQMKVSFDGSRSFQSLGSAITSYAWNFGDGSPVDTLSGAKVAHTYATPGRYRSTLTVTDAQGRTGNAIRFVSPASTTVDILMDGFFKSGCPYRDYWDTRYNVYGDRILRNEVPCTDYYPWVLFSSAVELQRINPSYVYTLYHWDAKVRNHPAYNVSEPVMFPVFNYSVAPAGDSFIRFNLTFEYLDSPLYNALRGTPFQVNSKYYSDGFGHVVRGNITMDLTMSKRIFDVHGSNAAEARAWWAANTNASTPRFPGPLETRYAEWLEDLGNNKYDVYNGFEWFYETDITWLKATVADDGTTTVQIFLDGWAYEVLQARWFYWGNASYQKAVCVQGRNSPKLPCTATLPYGAVKPQGWMPMETCWCEQATINGTIKSSLDLDFQGIQGYSFQAWANWGRDAFPGTSDDLPAWNFSPYQMDYVPRQGSGSAGDAGYPNSELRWYENRFSYHGSPGSYGYGQQLEYLVSPARWPLNAGSSLTLVMPRFEVPWYDPVHSTWNADEKIGNYVTFMSTMDLRLVRPFGDYFIWDPRAKTLSIAGPYDWTTQPDYTELPLEAWPTIEFGPETIG
jgi:chitodextrinase